MPGGDNGRAFVDEIALSICDKFYLIFSIWARICVEQSMDANLMDKASVAIKCCKCSNPPNQPSNNPTNDDLASICTDRRAVITPHSSLPEKAGKPNGALL